MIFNESYYRREGRIDPDFDRYRRDLHNELTGCTSANQREQLLHGEAIEITQHILKGIRHVAKHDRGVNRAVFVERVIPLGLWSESLQRIAESSASELRSRLLLTALSQNCQPHATRRMRR